MAGLLSGAEIYQAVRRQQQYMRLSNHGPHSDGPGLIDSWRLWRLHRQPRIFIQDFDPRRSHEGGQLGTNSYDLRLAPKLMVYKFGCLSDREDPPFLDMRRSTPVELITIGEDGVVLKPGVLYLGATAEYTETYNLVPYLDGRSSCGRLGMCIHITAGAGDVGFAGNWTCEITVVHPLKVYAGERIAQIRYHTVGPGWNYQGRYQKSTAIPVASRFHERT